MSSSSSNVSPSSDSRGSSPNAPNIEIERHSPSKVRLPSNLTDNNWTLVRRPQRPRARPAFDIDNPVQFPRLPPVSAKSAPVSSSEHSSDDDDVFKGRVQVALR